MKTVVITGATSGIGYATAKTLLQQGWHVLGVGRAQERCASAQAQLQALIPEASVQYFCADLMQQGESRRVAEEINEYLTAQAVEGLDALILNAGCARSWYATTAEGYEQQFALNYLSGVLLTHSLLPRLLLRKGRVLWTGSGSHKHTRVHWEDIMLQKHYNCLLAYKQSKLCGMLFAQAFNRRYAKLGARMYIVDPGLVNTDIGSKDTGGLVSWFWSLRKRGGRRPEIPAQTYAFLCNETPAPQELYFYACAPQRYSKFADNAEDAERLFGLSETLCGITFQEEAAV